jgi:hypothetical protein
MKKYFYLILLALSLVGCATTDKMVVTKIKIVEPPALLLKECTIEQPPSKEQYAQAELVEQYKSPQLTDSEKQKIARTIMANRTEMLISHSTNQLENLILCNKKIIELKNYYDSIKKSYSKVYGSDTPTIKASQ